MGFARRILRDPLVHFLLGGALLFAASWLFADGDSRSADETTIIVDEAALLSYMQYRSQAFEPAYFEDVFEAMSPTERQQLVDTYVREEAMVREARAMGLDDVDFVIRQRLIQKILFLADGTGDGQDSVDEEALQAYYEANRETYLSPGSVTFTHVFIDREKAHPGGGEAAARQAKARLAADRAGFNDAPAYGDRFPFLQNYIERAPDFVANQFGADFAAALARLEPADGWQGPIRSDYGWHLVLLTGREDAVVPQLSAIREQVLGDLMLERNAGVRQRAIDDLLSQYDVRVEGIAGVSSAGFGDD